LFTFPSGGDTQEDAHGIRHAPVFTDDPAHILLRNVQFNPHTVSPKSFLLNLDLGRVIYERTGDIFHQVSHVNPLSASI